MQYKVLGYRNIYANRDDLRDADWRCHFLQTVLATPSGDVVAMDPGSDNAQSLGPMFSKDREEKSNNIREEHDDIFVDADALARVCSYVDFHGKAHTASLLDVLSLVAGDMICAQNAGDSELYDDLRYVYQKEIGELFH